MDYLFPAVGTVRRRDADVRRLLPPPQFAELHEELGEYLHGLADTNAELTAAREELASAIAACDRVSRQFQSLESAATGGTVAYETVSEVERRSRLNRAKEERKHAMSFASILRLHIARLEYKVQEEMARIAELSEMEQMAGVR